MAFFGAKIKYAPINTVTTQASADEVVSAVSGKRINVLDYSLTVAAASLAAWRSATTDLSGYMSFAANGGISSPKGSVHAGPLFQTAAGEALNLYVSAATSAQGHLSYYEEG